MMRRSHLFRIVSPLIGIVLGAACSQGLAPGEPGRAVELARLRDEPCPLTFSSGLVEAQRMVVRDEQAWRETWTAIWRGHSPQPPLPPTPRAPGG